VLFDIDTEARELCDELGINMHRAATVGTHSKFIEMIRLLIEERLDSSKPRLALGSMGPNHDECPVDCCQYSPQRR
jgi:ferrochelatase